MAGVAGKWELLLRPTMFRCACLTRMSTFAGGACYTSTSSQGCIFTFILPHFCFFNVCTLVNDMLLSHERLVHTILLVAIINFTCIKVHSCCTCEILFQRFCASTALFVNYKRFLIFTLRFFRPATLWQPTICMILCSSSIPLLVTFYSYLGNLLWIVDTGSIVAALNTYSSPSMNFEY